MSNDVLSPKTTITPEQRRWANAILRMTAMRPPGEQEEPEQELPEANRYYGLSGETIVNEQRTLPPKFADALVLGAPMLKAADWQSVMEGRKLSQKEINDLLVDKEKKKTLLLEYKNKERDKNQASAIWHLINNAISSNQNCDLSQYGLGVVPFAQLGTRLNDYYLEYNRLNNELLQAKEVGANCLKALDAPNNNPEQAEVGGKLDGLEELETKYPKPLSTENEKKYVKEKADLLFELQDIVLKWNNRRTSENLPPCGDALALGDMVQRVHRELMGTVVAKGLPMPLSPQNEKNMSKEEKEEVQKTWTALVESGTKGSAEGSRLVVPKPPVGGLIPDEASAERFRRDVLADFSQLLQSPGGRSLAGSLNKGKHAVNFVPGGDEQRALSWDYQKRGVGSASEIGLRPGGKNSDTCLSTSEGNSLYDPTFLIMGHEMVHALHASEGRDYASLPMVEDSLWTNMEEYQTIFKGKHSEQTLRQQYGISAGRFGHGAPPKSSKVYEALTDGLETTAQMDGRNREAVDLLLTQRKFDPAPIPDKLKMEICDASLTGPIPDGWEASQLTFAQVKAIIGPPPIPAKLPEFGWTPYGLDGARIQQIYETREHHERSPKGLRMRALGGPTMVDLFAPFEQNTGIKLEAPKGTTWEDKLEALEAADRQFATLASTHENDDVKSAANGKGKLNKRIAAVEKVFATYQQELLTHGGDGAMKEIDRYNAETGKSVAKDETSLFSKVTSLRQAAQSLIVLKQSTTPEARSAIGNGNTGAQVKAAADLWAQSKIDFEKMGGDAAVKSVPLYAQTLSRLIRVNAKKDAVGKLAGLKLVQSDIANLKSTTTSPKLKSAIGGTNVLADMQAVIKAWKELLNEYGTLGADGAFAAIPRLNRIINGKLTAIGVDMPSKLEELKLAGDALLNFTSTHSDGEIKTIGATKKPFLTKVALIEKRLARKKSTEDTNREEETRKREVDDLSSQLSGAFETSKVTKLVDESASKKSRLKEVTDALETLSMTIDGLPGSIDALQPAIIDLETKAQAYQDHKDHQNPRSKKGKKRLTACTQMLNMAQAAKQQYEGVQARGRGAIDTAKKWIVTPDGIESSVVDKLAEILDSDYLSTVVRNELTIEIGLLRNAVNLQENLRTQDMQV